ncbi:MAG: filamentous hemagglutinin N-terminal domain-containing protein [Alkalinema sp. RL_2_19]|nr:filamentous hemagglutinin N-terminal domain-containing protein [Alkalinema sp. RL_2_19]
MLAKLVAVSGLMLGGLIVEAWPSNAQVASDGSLGSIVQNCPTQCQITGGTAAGNNLFHSLKNFSVPTGGTATFQTAPTIQRILRG